MHGLMNRSLQCFARDTYGQDMWGHVAASAGAPLAGFEALMHYGDDVTDRLLGAAEQHLDKPRQAILEDLGTYLVSHPNLEAVRRLLRFGGDNFTEFLVSLDDLPERAALAVPDLELPQFDVRAHSRFRYTLNSTFGFPGHGYVMVGILRAMADDYGVLAVMDHIGGQSSTETISVQMMETQFTSGREFDLSVGAA